MFIHTFVRVLIIVLLLLFTSCSSYTYYEDSMTRPNLSELQYHVTKEKGTEPAFHNQYWNEKREGIYVDINTGEALFSSRDKFDSGTGWPSFTKTIAPGLVQEHTDQSLGMTRTEVRTQASHLGHLFDDGPNGGNRYCINSASLEFIPKEEMEAKGYGDLLDLFD